MSLRILIIATTCCAALLSGCKKKTEAEMAEEERVKLRGEKRGLAAKAYKDLADKFPDHPKAKDAAAKASALAAPATK